MIFRSCFIFTRGKTGTWHLARILPPARSDWSGSSIEAAEKDCRCEIYSPGVLWLFNQAMEEHWSTMFHGQITNKTTTTGPFSMAMLNNHRVNTLSASINQESIIHKWNVILTSRTITQMGHEKTLYTEIRM